MRSTFDTVLVSALTSAVVALAIEWFAKPVLEARKERILGWRRYRSGFEVSLRQLMVVAAMWKDFEYPPDLPHQRQQKLRAEVEHAMEQVDSLTRLMLDEIGNFSATYVGVQIPYLGKSVQSLIFEYVTTARGIAISERTRRDKLTRLLSTTQLTHTYLFGSRWRPVSRGRALVGLPGALEAARESDGQNEPQSQQ